MFETENIEPHEVVNLMLQCIAFRKSCEAPEWKKRIDTLVIDKCKIQ